MNLRRFLLGILVFIGLEVLGQDINKITVTIFQNGSSIDTQEFTGFTPAQSIDETVSLNTSALVPGIYSFSVTVTDSDNVSSVLSTGTFVQEAAIVNNADVTDGEYFIDVDPGTGMGNPISFTPGADITSTETLNLSGLSPGFHTIYFRAEEETGLWGPYKARTIFVESSIGYSDVVTVEALEYFVDTDPGGGAGTPIGITPTSDISLTSTLSTAGLSPGFHTLYLRGKLENGAWGPYQSSIIYVESATGAGDVVTVEELEYFIDLDPGPGLGTPIAVSPAGDITLTSTINTDGLSPGFHTIYLRGKLEDGAWGAYQSSIVYIESAVGAGDAVTVEALEYFVDTDPGPGLATPIAISQSTDVSLTTSINSSGLTPGFHTVFLRGKLLDGTWGAYQASTVFVESNVGVADVVTIEALEYFVDTDPGGGMGTPIAVAPSGNISLTQTLNLAGLSEGFHTIYLRGKLEDGAWGPFTGYTILVESNSRTGGNQIVAMEYFVNTDPGVGNGIAITAGLPASNIDQMANINTSSLSPGMHEVSLRVQDQTGTWGHYRTQTVQVLAATLASSVNSGNWSNPATWSTGMIPASTDSVVVNHNITLDVASAGILALTLASGGNLDLNGNEIQITGRFASQSGGNLTASGGTIRLNGGNQTYEHTGDITHANLFFDGGGTKTLDYQSNNGLFVTDSLHVSSGVQLSFTDTPEIILNNNADFVNRGTIISTDKWSLIVDGSSHDIDGGDFVNVSFQAAATVNQLSDFNYDGSFATPASGATWNMGAFDIDLGTDWSFDAMDNLNFTAGAQLIASQGITFASAAPSPTLNVNIGSDTFDGSAGLIFGTNQDLVVNSGNITMGNAAFSGNGGLTVSGGTVNVNNQQLTFGNGGSIAIASGTLNISGASSQLAGATSSDGYSINLTSGMLSLSGTNVSELTGNGISLTGGTLMLSSVEFSNGLGTSYLTFGAGFDGETFSNIGFGAGPTYSVVIDNGVNETITFNNATGAFAGPANDNPGDQGTIIWAGGPSTPTTQASNVSITNIGETTADLSWTDGDGTSRLVFVAEGSPTFPSPTNSSSYTANATFGSGADLGDWFVVYNGSDNTVSISGLTGGMSYSVAVLEYNGTSGSELYNTSTGTDNPGTFTTNSSLSTPTTQASNVSITNIGETTADLSWTDGDGTSRLVFVAEGSPTFPSPTNSSSYTANATFGSGADLGDWFVVYNGSDNTVSISGLTDGTSYSVAVLEYNGTSGSELYNTSTGTDNPGTFTTNSSLSTPTTQASNVSITNIGETTADLSWTDGDGTSRLVFVAEGSPTFPSPTNSSSYTANATFGSGADLGDWFVVYNGSDNTVSISGLTDGTSYSVAVLEYNGTSGSELYNTSTGTDNPGTFTTNSSLSTPTTQASNVSITNIGETTADLSWTNGDGTSRLVFVAEGSPTFPSPTNSSSYTANATFGSGADLGDWFVVYNGSDNTVSISGLTDGTSYSVAVLEYNGTSGSELYNTSTGTDNPGTFTTNSSLSAPTTQASNVSITNIGETTADLSWTDGDGTSRLVFVAEGSPTFPSPTSSSSYTANATFGSGADLGDWFVVYNGSDNTVSISGLTGGTSYSVAVLEYNGTSGSELYNTSTGTDNPGTFTTNSSLSAPTTQASNVSITNIGETTADLSWTNGDGTSRLVFVAEGSPTFPSPTNSSSYTANATFGSGADLGDWFVVYNGSDNTVSISGLTDGTSYSVAVLEYNGTSGSELYNTSTGTDNPGTFTTNSSLSAPTTQASNVSITNIGETTADLSWTDGDGTSHLVFVAEGSPTFPSPTNSSSYTANATFGSGADLGDWFVVYNGSDNTVSISGLTGGTSYSVAVLEYNGTSGSELYNTSTGTDNPGTFTTTDLGLERDSLALVKIYEALQGASWTDNSGWLVLEVSNWAGVTLTSGRVRSLHLAGNNLQGDLPDIESGLEVLDSLDLSANAITNIGGFTSLSSLDWFNVSNNKLQFDALENIIGTATTAVYAPQEAPFPVVSELVDVGSSFEIDRGVSGSANSYSWTKDGDPLTLSGSILQLTNISEGDDGIYEVTITNSLVTDLTLRPGPIELKVSSLSRDRDALLVLYDQMGGQNWTNPVNWLDEPEVESWSGVTLNEGRVSGIDLRENNLIGELPTQILDIAGLQSLDLAENEITGLPDLRSLSELLTVDVSGNRLDFGDLEENARISGISYENQKPFAVQAAPTLVPKGTSVTIAPGIGGSNNSYQWSVSGPVANGDIAGAESATYTIPAIDYTTMGDYFLTVNNALVPGLTLTSAPQVTLATTTVSFLPTYVSNSDATVILDEGDGFLLKVTSPGQPFDSVASMPALGNELVFAETVLGDYLFSITTDTLFLRGSGSTIDSVKLLPTYYRSTFLWEEADTLFLRDQLLSQPIAMQRRPAPLTPADGDGTVGLFVESDFANERNVENGRVNARRKLQKVGCSLRRRRRATGGRPENDEFELVVYKETDADGRVTFENLPPDTYRLNIEYPGIPMDPDSFVEFEVGANGLENNTLELEATVDENGISVALIEELGFYRRYFKDLNVYPNPVSSTLNITYSKLLSDQVQLQILDLQGKTIHEQKMNRGYGRSAQVDVSSAQEGMYMLRFFDRKQPRKTIVSYKIIIRR